MGRTGSREPDRYTGPDRRSRTVEPPVPDRLGLGSAALVLLFLGGLVAVAATPVVDAASTSWVTALLLLVKAARGASAVVLVGTGVLLLVRARRTGRLPAALLGTGVLACAAATPLLPPGAGTLDLIGRHGVGVAAHVVGSVVLLLAVVLATRCAQVDGSARVLRLAVPLVGVGLLVQPAVVVAHALLGTTALPALGATAVHGVLAAAWCLTSVRLHRHPGALERDLARPTAFFLATGAVAAVLNGLAVASGDHEALLVVTAGAVLHLGAAALLAYHACRSLLVILTADSSREQHLHSRLTHHELAASRDRERLHDARATLAGLRCAREVLDGSHPDVPAVVREELGRAFTAELARLERVLAVPGRQAAVAELDDVIRPLVVVLRERGVTVRWSPSGHRARMPADDVATVVTALLDNVSAHAPGAAARVQVRAADGRLVVAVSDDGPGVPWALRDGVFTRGVSRDGSPGEGLGLAHARRLARGAGGDLRLVGRSGATFELSLPAVAQVSPAPPVTTPSWYSGRDGLLAADRAGVHRLRLLEPRHTAR